MDRVLRDRLADAVHALAAGFVTNDDFEDGLWAGGVPLPADPSWWPDAAIGPVGEMAWGLYTDTHRYRLAGRHKLPRERRREVLRWVLFLRTDSEYEWPAFRFANPALVSLSGCLLSLPTLGVAPRRRFAREFAVWQRSGDYDVWPFLRRADYEAACRRSCPFAAPRVGATG